MALQECRVALPAKEGGGGSGELRGGGWCSDVNCTSYFPSKVGDECESEDFHMWALRRKGVLGWGLVEDIKKGRRLFSGPPVLTTWGKLRLSGGCEKERVGLGHTH